MNLRILVSGRKETNQLVPSEVSLWIAGTVTTEVFSGKANEKMKGLRVHYSLVNPLGKIDAKSSKQGFKKKFVF